MWGTDQHKKSALPRREALAGGPSQKQPSSVYKWLQREETQDKRDHQLSHFPTFIFHHLDGNWTWMVPGGAWRPHPIQPSPSSLSRLTATCDIST